MGMVAQAQSEGISIDWQHVALHGLLYITSTLNLEETHAKKTHHGLKVHCNLEHCKTNLPVSANVNKF